jgi:DNA modification methylase
MFEPTIPNKIELQKTAILLPYARNSRTHSDAQIQQIASSIKEFGFTNPILIDENNQIIAGHGRLSAAHLLKIKEVPCIRLAHLTESQKKAYVIADNKLALNAGWDDAMLALELKDLESENFDLSLTGFNEDELAKLLVEAVEGQTDPDDVPEVQETAITVLGDIWTLGKHRLMCGDSTSIDMVQKLLQSVKPHLMVTDPPYGINYDPEENGKRTKLKTIVTGKVLNDDRADWKDAWSLFEGSVAYVWHADKKSHIVAQNLIDCGFEIRAQIIWQKTGHILGRGHYHQMHEPCWYAVRGESKWNGARNQDTVWKIGKERKTNDIQTIHGTQKPVECMKRPIENNSSIGQAIYEPFSGSGTTIIAGEITQRHIYGMELNPLYVDVAIKRWQDFTGKNAVHSETGKTFNEMMNERSNNSPA